MSKSNTGKRYAPEFKEQLYELNQNGSSVSKLSSEYGIRVGTIYKWFFEIKPITETDAGTQINKKELDAMRKCIKELEMENEILKKATAIFARKP